jgi:hypothetical protein
MPERGGRALGTPQSAAQEHGQNDAVVGDTGRGNVGALKHRITPDLFHVNGLPPSEGTVLRFGDLGVVDAGHAACHLTSVIKFPQPVAVGSVPLGCRHRGISYSKLSGLQLRDPKDSMERIAARDANAIRAASNDNSMPMTADFMLDGRRAP